MATTPPAIRKLNTALDVLLADRFDEIREADSDDLLDLLGRIGPLRIKPLERAIVTELRARNETWATIGSPTGRDQQAAEAYYGERANNTRRPKRESLPGLSVKDAAGRLGIVASTVYGRIEAEPDAPWHVRVQVGGKRGEVDRIVDLKGLELAGGRRSVRPSKATELDATTKK